jgi:hypothetical protein
LPWASEISEPALEVPSLFKLISCQHWMDHYRAINTASQRARWVPAIGEATIRTFNNQVIVPIEPAFGDKDACVVDS